MTKLRMPQVRRPVRVTTDRGTFWMTEVEAAQRVGHPALGVHVESVYCPSWRERLADFWRRAMGTADARDEAAVRLARQPRCLP